MIRSGDYKLRLQYQRDGKGAVLDIEAGEGCNQTVIFRTILTSEAVLELLQGRMPITVSADTFGICSIEKKTERVGFRKGKDNDERKANRRAAIRALEVDGWRRSGYWTNCVEDEDVEIQNVEFSRSIRKTDEDAMLPWPSDMPSPSEDLP